MMCCSARADLPEVLSHRIHFRDEGGSELKELLGEDGS